MSIQTQLNNDCINKLPKIKEILSKVDNCTSNKIIDKTLHAAMNASKSIDEMDINELYLFQTDLINAFKFYEWI